MVDRRALNVFVRIASALALLVAVTVSPLRLVKCSDGASRSDASHATLASCPAPYAFPIRVVPTSVASRPVVIKALHAEEEELSAITRQVGSFFSLRPTLSSVLPRGFAFHGGIPILVPLRC